MRKVAVLGGGMAGLTAAWRLSEHAADELEITVYQRGWQLGGKGASGRGVHGRIEEHGLHVWLGYYENAFRLIREVYGELDRSRTAPACPIRDWRDAFTPAGRVGIEDRGGGQWQHWVAEFSPQPGEPGDATPGQRVGGTASVAEFVQRGLRLLADFSTSLGTGRRTPATAPAGTGRPPVVVLSGSPDPPQVSPAPAPDDEDEDVGTLAALMEQARLAAVVAAVETIRRLGGMVPAQTTNAVLGQLHRLRTDLDRVVSNGNASLRRMAELADLVVSCLVGVVADGLLTDPDGFGAIDDEDFRDWLRRHGARPQTRDSALVRGMYDLVFAYADGDRSRPRFAAGLGLFLAGKFFFDYRGSLFWQMRAGMGDVVFAPLYQALRARGVRFAFFHRLDGVHLTNDRRSVTALSLTREARLRVDEEDFTPLQEVKGLPCFRSRPDPDQVDAAGEAVEPVRLVAGHDFDVAVLAVSIGALSQVCAELVADSQAWRDTVRHVATVPTQSLQVWLHASESELGWHHPGATVSGYAEPFDTYASMSHLLAAEDWPGDEPPRALAYFCGSLRADGWHGDLGQARRVVEQNARVLLEAGAGHFWPGAVDGGAFRWDLLVGADGGRGAEPAGLEAQYWRANVDPSDRYVQSLPGTQRYRLRADQSGYDNLVLAGDWTNCGLNAGCIEAAVLSGSQAANTVLGRPLMSGLAGTWYGVPE